MIINFEEILEQVKGNGDITARLKFEPQTHVYNRPDYLINKIQNKKVIHLGCTDHLPLIQAKLDTGQYLHMLMSASASKCIGIDINEEAIEFLKSNKINNVIYANILDDNIDIIKQDVWDYIVLGEMLEHIDNPVEFLKTIKLNYGKYIKNIIITVPNAFGVPFITEIMNNGTEFINYDHRYWFTPYTILKVANQAGLIIKDLEMCIYDTSIGYYLVNEQLLKNKPILLDSIILECSFE